MTIIYGNKVKCNVSRKMIRNCLQSNLSILSLSTTPQDYLYDVSNNVRTIVILSDELLDKNVQDDIIKCWGLKIMKARQKIIECKKEWKEKKITTKKSY